jgi:hypothetical protein
VVGNTATGIGIIGVTVNTTSTRFSWKVGDSGSTGGVPVIAPAPVLGVVHSAVFAGIVVPTALEQTRTETVLDEAFDMPIPAIAEVETRAALGCAP